MNPYHPPESQVLLMESHEDDSESIKKVRSGQRLIGMSISISLLIFFIVILLVFLLPLSIFYSTVFTSIIFLVSFCVFLATLVGTYRVYAGMGESKIKAIFFIVIAFFLGLIWFFFMLYLNNRARSWLEKKGIKVSFSGDLENELMSETNPIPTTKLIN